MLNKFLNCAPRHNQDEHGYSQSYMDNLRTSNLKTIQHLWKGGDFTHDCKQLQNNCHQIANWLQKRNLPPDQFTTDGNSPDPDLQMI